MFSEPSDVFATITLLKSCEFIGGPLVVLCFLSIHFCIRYNGMLLLCELSGSLLDEYDVGCLGVCRSSGAY